MRHKNIYYFIDKFNKDEILSLNKNINLIFRNYDQKNNEQTIQKLSHYCKINHIKLFISNNLRLALKYKLNGLYIPSFNKILKYKNLNVSKNFKIIGSAHNFPEIKIKEKQGCDTIVLSPIFSSGKNRPNLGIIKFNYLSIITKKKIIALGGINSKNLKKLKSTFAIGFAGISMFKKKALS